MNIRKVLAGLLAGTGIALLGAAALADDVDLPDDFSSVALKCTVSSGTSPTGREWGSIEISRQNPNICIRRRVGGAAPPDFDSCHSRSHELGCTTVIDA